MSGGSKLQNDEDTQDLKSKSYKKWTKPEMDALVTILVDLVGEGQKSDNGFRAGYLNTCVERLEVIFPGTKFSEKNVKHRYQQWKKVFVEVKGIDGSSGMGFDYTNKRLKKVDNDVWNTYVKVHKKVAGYRNKDFPYYEDWKTIFGHDQADGEIGRNFTMAFDEIQNADPASRKRDKPEAPTGDYYPNMEGVINLEPPVDESKGPETESPAIKLPKSPPKKKAKAWALKSKNAKHEDVALGQISTLLEKLVEGNEGRMNLITKHLAAEEAPSTPLSAARDSSYNEPLKDAEEIMSIVESMDLTSIQQIMTSTRIAMNPFYSKMFLRLKPDARAEFVTALMQNKLP